MFKMAFSYFIKISHFVFNGSSMSQKLGWGQQKAGKVGTT